MKMKSLLLCFMISSSLLLMSFAAAKAVTCDPMQLSSCADAILSAAKPSAACCAKLKQQQPCFCQYAKTPSLKGYINSKNGRKVAETCKCLSCC
ncbi:hypothetical protein J5N97_019499 [Dioscorea zingiberensis]|uniref:Bifunctional inhibitor/plant lipid transfer protein/seed storage helical domain-containing protein n=1 Tax=Dioscorea zingiberensis TaxID=325984 RepID=A0A9D5CEU9_9LILI|nr:hypothetical protein J5N97_019499 [Dioscorea zingiberensis]